MESVFFREVNYYINFFYYVLDNVIYSTNSISKFWLLHDIKRKVELSPCITISKKNKTYTSNFKILLCFNLWNSNWYINKNQIIISIYFKISRCEIPPKTNQFLTSCAQIYQSKKLLFQKENNQYKFLVYLKRK